MLVIEGWRLVIDYGVVAPEILAMGMPIVGGEMRSVLRL